MLFLAAERVAVWKKDGVFSKANAGVNVVGLNGNLMVHQQADKCLTGKVVFCFTAY